MLASRSPASCGRRAFGPASRRSLHVVSSASVKDLNTKFGIDNYVSVVEGRGGLPTVVLKHNCGASAEVILFGGVVSSWKQPSGDEVLYVRPDAVFDKSKPISGGIPHCFPQFGPPGKMQQHGFARNLDWALSATSANPQPDECDPEVEIVLSENDYTTKMWPFKFKAVYTVRLHGDQLQTELRVINTDSKKFDFTAALHSYFEVAHIEQAKVKGLKGLKYLDKSVDPKNPTEKVEERDAITFSDYTDYVYEKAPSHLELEVGTGAAITIDANNWADAVVWNPWHTMKACYERFVCVENAQFSSAIELAPGESWAATSNFGVVDVKK